MYPALSGRKTFKGCLDRGSQTLSQYLYFVFRNDKRRCKQNVVSVAPINGSPHRVNHESACKSLAFYPCMQLQGRVENLLGRAIFDQLKTKKQAATAYISDVGMAVKLLVQVLLQYLALVLDAFEQVFVADDVLYGQ